MTLPQVKTGDLITSTAWNLLVEAVNKAVNTIANLPNRFVLKNGDTISGDVMVQGKVTANKFVGLNIFVYGMIIMWSGTKEDIPDGWIVCDGSDKRAPDLSERFIRCVSKEAEEVYTDGVDEASYKLTKQMVPNHSHKISCNQNNSIEHKVYLISNPVASV